MQQQPGQQPAGGHSPKIYHTEHEIRGGNLGFFAYALYEELLLPLWDGATVSYNALLKRPLVQRVLHPRTGVAHSDVLGGLGFLAAASMQSIGDVRDSVVEQLHSDFKTVGPATLASWPTPLETRLHMAETAPLNASDGMHHTQSGYVPPVPYRSTRAR